MALHVVLGGVYVALAPLQFVGRIRSRHLGYHRWAGRWIERGYIGVFGVLYLVALVKGFVHVRVGRVALYREWMIRAFAIGLAVTTMRLIFVPALLVVATETQGQVAILSAASFLAAFVFHSSVAEAWIRLTRRNGVPGAREAKAA